MNKNHTHSLGKINKWEKTVSGLSITAENANMEIDMFSNCIMNIHISKKNITQRPFSYSVIQKPIEIKAEIKAFDQYIEINNHRFITKIQKCPLRINFLSLERNAISSDDPAFGTRWIGNEVTTYKSLFPGEKFIGLGEKTGNLNRRGKAYTNWNHDHFAYPLDADPLYSSIPFYIGIHDNLCYGIFLDNSHKTIFNFGASNNRFSYFSAEDGEMNYYFIYGNTISEIIKEFTWLTGRMELPPVWSLGLHQCRYSYYPDKEVLRIAQTFREKEIPCDALWLDIHYMDKYKVFTFDPQQFSNPKQLSKDLKKLDFNTVVILDPGIKVENDYEVYEDGIKNDVFVKYPDLSNYEAEVWPGWSVFPDFTNPVVRQWWGKWMKFYTQNGIEGFWTDMNEPASWGQHTPDLIEFDYESEKTTHKKARNIYGMQMARATFEGSKKLNKEKRAFVLTRAGFAGIQRYAAKWTGDNVSSDEHMMLGIRLVNSLGISGAAFSGYDVGGFSGEATPELYARWISIGAFSPFFRCHSMINSKSAEPWSYGEKTFEIALNYIRLRYQLLPYLYSAFYEASKCGIPIARSLAIYWPHDEKIYLSSYQNQYLFGENILVAPLESDKEFAKVYLPHGNWYDFHTDKLYEGKQEIVVEAPLEKLPLFIRGGSIIPMQSVVNSTKEKTDEVLYIHLYKGFEPYSYEYHEDDGSNNEYNNNFYKRTFTLTNKKLELETVKGKYPTKFKRIKIYWHGEHPGKIQVNGKTIFSKDETHSFLKAISNFDPFIEASRESSLTKIKSIESALSNRKMVVEWQ
jgi:alpha-glucosidase